MPETRELFATSGAAVAQACIACGGATQFPNPKAVIGAQATLVRGMSAEEEVQAHRGGKAAHVHELSICQGIIEIAGSALAEHLSRGSPVSTVTVRIGRLTGIDPDSLHSYFDLLSPATPLAGATLVIDEVPIRGRCMDCTVQFVIDTLAFTCPDCGSGFVELLSGRELQVVSLETAEEMVCAS